MGQAKNTRKKQNSGGSPSSYSEIYKKSASNATAPIVASDGSASAAAVAAPARTSDEVDWKGEYGYVISDLKRLGLITALIAGAIIVVGFFV